MNIILQFNFETGDESCRYYQVYVVVSADAESSFDELEDSISSYFESTKADGDLEFNDYVNDIMQASGLTWAFLTDNTPNVRGVHSFWI